MEMREQRTRRWFLAAMFVVVAVAGGFVALPMSAEASDDYPYRHGDPSQLDPAGFYYRHCTSFVAWRVSRRGEFTNYMRGGHWWHARNWAENAQRLGFRVDQTPAPGAIAHYYAGEQGAQELGHVAFVAAVNGDGSVVLEEYNGADQLGYSVRGPTRAPRYIHVYDDVAPAAVPEPVAEPTEPAPPAGAARVRAPVERRVDTDRSPVGRLTAPEVGTRLRAGRTVTVSGEFKDDSRVTRVDFFAADDRYNWRKIGTDAHGGNGTYTVPWKVDFPHGSKVSVYAEVQDDAGNRVASSVAGVEGLIVALAADEMPDHLEAEASDVGVGRLAHVTGPDFTLPALAGGVIVLLATFGAVWLIPRRRAA